MAKQQKADSGMAQNGHQEEVAKYEQRLASYLQERIKPGLNSGAIPLVARSIAKEIARWEPPSGGSEDAEAEAEHSAVADDEPSDEAEDEPGAEADDERSDEAEDEPSAEADDDQSADGEAPLDFEDDMHEWQAKLGEDWVLSFSVQGEDGWLTAEKGDGTQRLEAQTAAVLLEAVELLDEGGGRSS